MSSQTKLSAATPASTLSENQRLILNLGIKTTVGIVSSGLLSLLVARRSVSRLFVTGLGTGFGMGYGWCQNDFYLKNPTQSVGLPESFQAEFDRYWKKASGSIPDFAKFK